MCLTAVHSSDDDQSRKRWGEDAERTSGDLNGGRGDDDG